MGRDLADQIVLVTGAARGIGAETARLLVERGARVALVDRDGALVKETTDALGAAALPIEADVIDAAAMADAVGQVVDAWGGIDVVVANAGIAGPTAPVLSVDPDAFQQVLDVNIGGVWRTVRAALPYVVERRGYVLLIASVAAAIPTPAMAAYGMSKAAVDSFGRSLAIELAGTGTAVGIGYFGLVDTELLRGAGPSGGLEAVAAGLPGFISKPISSTDAAGALVRGIEHRSRRVMAPSWVQGALWLRGELTLVDRTLHRLPAVGRMLKAHS